jgi:hypothetical protein
MPFPCRAHAVTLPWLAAKGLDYVFPIWFTWYGLVWPTHTITRPCHSTTMPFWKWLLKAAHGFCELTSAVHRRHVGELPAFGFFRLPRSVPESCYQKHTNPLNCRLAVRIFPATAWTFTKDTALSENDKGAAWRVWFNEARHGMETAWARYVMRELALKVLSACDSVRRGSDSGAEVGRVGLEKCEKPTAVCGRSSASRNSDEVLNRQMGTSVMSVHRLPLTLTVYIPVLIMCTINCISNYLHFIHTVIATGYGLDGPGIESRWGRDFPNLSRTALGLTQPPVQWVPCLSWG